MGASLFSGVVFIFLTIENTKRIEFQDCVIWSLEQAISIAIGLDNRQLLETEVPIFVNERDLCEKTQLYTVCTLMRSIY